MKSREDILKEAREKAHSKSDNSSKDDSSDEIVINSRDLENNNNVQNTVNEILQSDNDQSFIVINNEPVIRKNGRNLSRKEIKDFYSDTDSTKGHKKLLGLEEKTMGNYKNTISLSQKKLIDDYERHPVIAALLALFLGHLGAHCFYMREPKDGYRNILIFIIATILYLAGIFSQDTTLLIMSAVILLALWICCFFIFINCLSNPSIFKIFQR